MAGNEASWAIELPNQFEPFGNILQREIDAQGNQNQYFYNQQLREQQKQEQDKWKKLALIQDYTDLSKHQTGSDVANAIGNQKMASIVQKYSQLSSKMSPEQLLYELNKEVSGTVNAMDGIKNELQIGEESIKQLKQSYPYLNAEQMAKDFRQDVLDRRLKNDTEFTPQLSIGQSNINFSDPEILAKYVTGNKSLLKAINEDKGDEVTALMGKQGDYTKYEGRIKPYQKLGYDPAQVNSKGFYVGKDIPSFKIKSSILPAETMTDSGGNPLEIIDEDVYQRYAQDGGINLELIAATKQAFPNYSELSPQQKNYAKRNTLYKIISANDQSRMNPKDNVRPPVTNIRNYSGGGGSKEPTPIDLRDKGEYPDAGGGFQDVTRLFQGVKVTGLPDGKTLNAEYVKYNPSTGVVRYKEYTGTAEKQTNLTTLFQNIQTNNPGIDMNFLQGLRNPITGEQKSKTYSVGGKTLTQEQIEKGAAKYKMTVSEYLKSIGAN